LEHEGRDESVDGRVGVGGGGAEGEEVVGCARGGGDEEFEFEVAVGCV